jgi:hypothetical protein
MIETEDSPIVAFMEALKSDQGTLYSNIDRPMHIDDATISAIWLAPLSASSGNITRTKAIIAMREMTGIAEISGLGVLHFSCFII